jgi:uncharacterized protein YfiM (DUF2279 family)
MHFALALSLSLGGHGDHWLGQDKVKHFFLSAFVQSGAYASFRAAGAGHGTSLLGATAVTTTLGVGKEVHDRNTPGDFSVRDLVADAAGAGAATLLLVHTDRSNR